jgi:hypothetical protein
MDAKVCIWVKYDVRCTFYRRLALVKKKYSFAGSLAEAKLFFW